MKKKLFCCLKFFHLNFLPALPAAVFKSFFNILWKKNSNIFKFCELLRKKHPRWVSSKRPSVDGIKRSVFFFSIDARPSKAGVFFPVASLLFEGKGSDAFLHMIRVYLQLLSQWPAI